MADDHGTTADDPADFAAHESTYEGFITATEVTLFYVLSIVLLLLIWGILGHGGVALIGFIVATLAALAGAMLNLGWRAGAPVFVLLGLVAILLH